MAITALTGYTGDFPDRNAQTPEVFNINANDYHAWYVGSNITALNTFIGQVNTTETDVESDKDAAETAQTAADAARAAAVAARAAAVAAQAVAEIAAAIAQAAAAALPSGSINDDVTNTGNTWSSDKINTELETAGAQINDDATNTTETWSSDKINTEIGNVDLGSYAPLVSPVFTDEPSAPTPPTSDNSERIATTAFVTAKLNNRITVSTNAPSGGSAGDIWFEY